MSRHVTAVPGGVTSHDLVAWALRCSMPNQWLEFPDVLLYCHKEVQDGMKFAREILGLAPEEDAAGPEVDKNQRVAILCAADYDGDVDIERCVHWVPGWFRSDDDPADLFTQLCDDSKSAMQKRLDLLGSPPKGASDNDEAYVRKLAHAEEVERITSSHDNLTKMQLALWNDFRIAAKGTVGDGNCGVEMLLSFCENAAVAAGEAAPRRDMLDIITAYRKELQRLWHSVSGVEFWQDLWQKCVGARANMDQWKELCNFEPLPRTPIGTPPRGERKQNREASVTPQKTLAPGKLLAKGEGEPELSEVVVEAGQPPQKKAKPTGKPKSPSEVIKFEVYFPKFLAERGLTYREWISEHKRTGKHMPFLDIQGLGPAKGEWPEHCVTCQQTLQRRKLNHAELIASVAAVQGQVEKDLKHLETHGRVPLKELKRKDHPVQTDASDQKPSKSVKTEPAVKKEQEGTSSALVKVEKQEQPSPQPMPAPAKQEIMEALMGLNELIAYHRLKKLEKSTHGKKFPVECNYCSCIFEGRNKAKVAQHTNGFEHRRRWTADLHGGGLQPLADVTPMDEAASGLVKGTCKGMRLKSSFGQKTRLGSAMFPVWEEYVKYANLNKSDGPSGNTCHSVTALCNTGDWILRSANCKKEDVQVHIDGEDAVCEECSKLCSQQRYLHKVSAFVHSMDEARLLYHRMFAEESLEEFLSELRESANYQNRAKVMYEQSIEKDVAALHHRVGCVWRGRMGQENTQALNLFFAQFIQPCLDTEPGHPVQHKAIERLMRFMTNDPNTSSLDANLVKSIVTGKLSRHPAMQGVLIGCMAKLRNWEEGKTTMRNRYGALVSDAGESLGMGCKGEESERQLLIQAGAELSANGANHQALEYFGLQWIHRNEWQGSLAKIESLGLPVHTAPDHDRMLQNDHVISCLFGRADDCPQRRLVLCFDRTYITACSQLATTMKRHVMLGGAHRPQKFELPDESQAVLRSPSGEVTKVVLKKNRTLANDMEACIVWDCTRKGSPTFDLASFPCCSSACRDTRFEEAAADLRKRGNWEVLCRIGEVLNASPSIKHVIADAHGSHQYLGRWMLGLDVALSDELKSHVPFFGELTFQDLPMCCFPIGARVALYKGESVHWWPGPAHMQKNFVSQMRSVLGTIHYGNRWCDHSASLELGLFPTSYIGTDTMSDKQAALWLLGIFHIFRGSLLMLDFGELMAKERATRTGCKLREMWLDARPARCMRHAACSAIVACWASDAPLCFERLTERNLEKRFGRVRSYYPNAAMSVGDYWRASLHCMQREFTKWQEERHPPQVRPAKGMSQNTFCSTASRAFQAALKLAAMCSDKTRSDLQAAFNLSFARARGDDQQEEVPAQDVSKVFERIRASHAFQVDPEAVKVKASEGKKPEDPKIADATDEVIGHPPSASEHQHASFRLTTEKRTLSEALAGHENLESALPDLWRLLWFLRSGEEGSDVEVLPKPMLSRQRVLQKPQKWQNLVQHQISLLDVDSKAPAVRQGRQQAWMKHMEKTREDHCPALPPNISVDRGDVLAVRLGKEWCPGLVLSIWRNFKQGPGSAQLCPRSLSRGSLAAVRVACLALEEGSETVYRATSTSLCCVVKYDAASRRALKSLAELNLDLGPEADKPKTPALPRPKPGPRFIIPIVDNYRRTKKGRKLIVQECSKLIVTQSKRFPAKSMLDLDGKTISWKFNGAEGAMSYDEFLVKVPHVIDNYFVQVRRKVDFGAKVHAWLTNIEKEMSQSYRFKQLQELVWMVSVTDLAATKGSKKAFENVDKDKNKEDEEADDGMDTDNYAEQDDEEYGSAQEEDGPFGAEHAADDSEESQSD
eukprot:s487_g2.t1